MMMPSKGAEMEWVGFGVAGLFAVAAAAIVILLTRARLIGQVVAAETRLAEAQRLAAGLTSERDAARLAEQRATGELAAARQELKGNAERLADFERHKAEFLTFSKAAVLTVGQELSSKLLEDHKRENEAANKEGEEKVKKATETLVKQLDLVAMTVAQLQGQVKSDGQRIETVVRALSNPSGAGQFGEILLANTLTSFGMVEDRDFKLQFTTTDAETGQRRRPDAVIFLPGGTVLVIDCKASKFLFDIAEAEGTAAETGAYDSLARTMNEHLAALAGKDYRAAVVAAYRQGGFPGEIARVISIMYLPSESAVERLQKADANFMQRAASLQIIPAGPAGLACILSFASTEIGLSRQIENRERIVEVTQALLDSISIVLNHALGLGRGIKTAAEGFEKLTKSVNRTLLPRARRLAQLGVQSTKGLPANLTAYQVMSTESDLIEGESEDVTEPEPAPPEIVTLVKQAGE